MSASDSDLSSSSPEPEVSTKKRGRPQSTPLEPYKDEIVRLFIDEDVPIIEIARRLNVNHGLDISERTISRRLTQWKVPRKKTRTTASVELQERIIYHYNKNLNDDQMARALLAEGYEIKPRNLARLRQKLGMRRRSKYPEFREYSEEELDNDPMQASTSSPRASPKKPRKKAKKVPPNAALIPKVTAFVEKYMSKYDGSHDFNHIKRVVGLAHKIYTEIIKAEEQSGLFEKESSLDLHVITLAALLHDVGDKKYLEPGQKGETLVLATLLGFGAPEDLALKVQRIVLAVSYSSEIKDPGHVETMIGKYPELAIVQDADRLDAIGAVGIGRTFTFGGAKNARDMGETIQHFDDKLVKLESMMKTAPGKRMARERTERLNMFKSWWEEEQREAEGLLRRK
ncbi:hypothetical protein ONS95_003642 [Cadophora gregata]|uniref:uncharacterized protein n=1 Tax=Cadophora gregata TaxID=51156 RepID=UPI0026DD73E8|nr:uncharacterized protein ONS95_003642 [Cadophora gregata]KAK0106926.1 hypothetical protein ONS95_003642 [Cadophora gregata]KAK0116616.1 hypothetical protein ONS96_012472 [Cadophora gregata f. sp. sojae]